MQTLRDFEEKPCVEVYEKDKFFICSAMLINNIYVYNTFVEKSIFLSYQQVINQLEPKIHGKVRKEAKY